MFELPSARPLLPTIAALALLAIAPSVAVAAGPPVVSSAFVTDGSVAAVVADDTGRFYVGGQFSQVGPATGSALLLTTTDDEPKPSFPQVAGTVEAVVADGAGGWFLGGSFTQVGGVPRRALAHVLADGSVDPQWAPSVTGGNVNALLRSGGDLYVGGSFAAVNGRSRTALVKLSTSTGAVVLGFNGQIGGNSPRVNVLGQSDDSLYAGGFFTSAGGQPRANLARLSSTSGTSDATWDPSPDGNVTDLAVAANAVFVTGAFQSIGAAARAGVAKLADTGTGAADPAWDANVAGVCDAVALSPSGDHVYLGGFFATVGPDSTPRDGVAKLSTAGPVTVASWAPATDGFVEMIVASGDRVYLGGRSFAIAGQRLGIGRVSASGSGALDEWDPNPNGGVNAVAVDGTAVVAGGSFSSAGSRNLQRSGLARLLANGTLDTSWNPTSAQIVTALALSGSELFAGGLFDLPGGADPETVVKFPTGGTGAATAAWRPSWTRPPTSLAVSGGSVFVAGASTFNGGFLPDALMKYSATGTGAADATWDAAVTGTVDEVRASAGSLYVGGTFGSIGSVARSGVARVSTASPLLVDSSWNPSATHPTSPVHAFALAGQDVYLGGDFTFALGEDLYRNLVKVSGAAGAALVAPFNPFAFSSGVDALALSGSDLYVAGRFTSIGSVARPGVAKLSATGAVSGDFAPGPDGRVTDIAATPSRVMLGGEFGTVDGRVATGLAMFDLSTPAAAIAVPADGARYRRGQAVAAAYSCTDPAGAGDIATCTGAVPTGSRIDTATGGTHTFTATATDIGGHTDTATVSYFVDASAPAITIAPLPGGGSYSLGEAVVVSYTCEDADGGQDVAACAGPVAPGGLLDTATAGAKTFTVTATDVAGNTRTSAVSYSVRAAAAPLGGTPGAGPILGRLRISPLKFRAIRRGPPTAKATPRAPKKGATVSFNLSKAARVTFTIHDCPPEDPQGASEDDGPVHRQGRSGRYPVHVPGPGRWRHARARPLHNRCAGDGRRRSTVRGPAARGDGQAALNGRPSEHRGSERLSRAIAAPGSRALRDTALAIGAATLCAAAAEAALILHQGMPWVAVLLPVVAVVYVATGLTA